MTSRRALGISRGQLYAVALFEEQVVGRPRDQRGLVELGQPGRDPRGDFGAQGQRELAQVFGDRRIGKRRAAPRSRESVDVAVRQTVIRASARNRRPHRLGGGPKQRLGLGRGEHRLEDRWRKVFERITTGEYQRTEPLGMVHRDELRDDPAGVVADQHHIVEVEGGQDIGDDAGDAVDGAVGAGTQRLWMRAERPGGGDAPQAPPGESLADLAPQLAAHHVPVHEHDGPAVFGSGCFVMDGSGVNVDLRHG